MPSVAAVTASYDRYGMQYAMYPQVQQRADKNAAEVIEHLDVRCMEFLNGHKNATGFGAKKIIYFRDGVGEGQYAEVGLAVVFVLFTFTHDLLICLHFWRLWPGCKKNS
jgi:Piwi domain